MVISHKNKFIYIKAKKVASTSIEVYFQKWCGAIEENNHKSDEIISKDGIISARNRGKSFSGIWKNHMTPLEIKKALGEDLYNSYIKIVSIRNPYDIAVSLYHFRKNKEVCKDNFLKFIKEEKNIMFLESNNEYWSDDDSLIIRYENLENDMRHVTNILGIHQKIFKMSDLMHFKKSDRTNYKEYYNEESYDIITNIYKDAIKKYNYKF